MNITTSIVNFIGTPGAYTDVFSNRPLATSVNTGTLYFSNDTNVLYQSTGSTWITYGGSGTIPDLDQVLNEGNEADTDIILSLNHTYRSYNTDINEQTYLTFQAIGSGGDNNSFISFYQNQFNEIRTGNANSANFYQGIRLDFDNTIYYFGDWNNNNNGTKIVIDDDNIAITFEQDIISFNGAIETGTSGSSSGQHLQVTVNGTPYVIELKNP